MGKPLVVPLCLLALATLSSGLPRALIQDQYQSQDQQPWHNDQQSTLDQSNIYPDFGSIEQSQQNQDQSSYPDIPEGQILAQSQSGEKFPPYGPAGSNIPNFHGNSGIDAGLTVSCNNGKVCVPQSSCVNGYVVVTENFVKHASHECKINSEVCCAPTHDVGYGQEQSETEFGQSDQQNVLFPVPQNEFDNAGSALQPSQTGGPHAVDVDQTLSSGDATNPLSVKRLPPVGENGVPTHVQLGCAAALLCVEERYCTMQGEVSNTPVALSEKQLLRRMPLSDCRNPDSGVIGKCCRDPNYVDPWPGGNLPANYTGGFDEQGFPTFLNIAKVRPPHKPSPGVKNPPTKTSPPRPNVIPRPSPPVVHVGQPEIPQTHEISQPTNNFPSILISSTPAPLIPNEQVYLPPKPVTFAPIAPRPFTKSPIPIDTKNLIAKPQIPRSQCGVKNNIPRPEGLRDAETAFGEIPWQAMVLSNENRKLLCSGVLVKPDMVLTAAHCVDSLEANQVSVKFGEWKLGFELKHEEPLPFEIVNVLQIVRHPNFNGLPSSDMAILLLEHPAALNIHVNPLCVPDHVVSPPSRTHCIVTGWGKEVLEGNLAGAIMRVVDVDVLPTDACQQRLQGAESAVNINGGAICVKAQRQGNNMCQVDVGGPLACDRGDGRYDLVGIYSQDTGCLPTNQVAVFAPFEPALMNTVPVFQPPKVQPEVVVPHVTEPSLQTQDSYDYRKSNLPPNSNQYLPPLS